MGTLLTPLGLLYSDVAASIPIAVQIFFFLTPVVYPVPDSFPMSLVTVLNPVAPLLVGARDLITIGTMSNPGGFLAMAGLACGILLAAWVAYRIALPILIERLGA